MTAESSKGKGLKVLVVLVIVAALGWFGSRAWTAAASPGEEQVMGAFRARAALTDEEVWESLDFTVKWAEDMPGLRLEVGDWAFRAGRDYLRPGSWRKGLDADERYVFLFPNREEQDGTGEAGEHYFLTIVPVSFVARIRLYWHELGASMSDLDEPKWMRFITWTPPDRDPERSEADSAEEK